MKDTLVKLRALVGMKTALIKALTADLEIAARRIEQLETELEQLEAEKLNWWASVDSDEQYIEENTRY